MIGFYHWRNVMEQTAYGMCYVILNLHTDHHQSDTSNVPEWYRYVYNDYSKITLADSCVQVMHC